MSRTVSVRAPSRMHFGMFSFGHPNQPQFGGVGVMIEPPTVDVTIVSADQLTCLGDHAERAKQFVTMLATHWSLSAAPQCRIHVSALPAHRGLGLGTQLGLAIAAGLRDFLRMPPLTVAELALAVERGARSAIGTHGFEMGGLLVDGGKRDGEEIGQLERRISLPAEWRFVLARSRTGGPGLMGQREKEAFSQLPPVPETVTEQLWRIANEEMLPAIERADCDAFGEAVYRFGRLAGECFATVQGGPFASRATAELVAAIRNMGVPGVGQSSWGPTVFAITPNEAKAHELVARLRAESTLVADDITIARPNNVGAQVSTLS